MASSLFKNAAIAVQSAAKLSANAIERARDSLPLPAGGPPKSSKTRIVGLLESRFDLEKLEGLRLVMHMARQGEDASEFFAAVVKNAVTSNLEVRRLTYAYIVMYAGRNPEIALLAVNALQRDLCDPNFATRVLALRTFAQIHIDSVIPLIGSALQTASKDISPAVRRTVIHCLNLCSNLVEPELINELLAEFLKDRDPNVVGAAAVEFRDRLDQLHPHYRKLCDLLPQMDEVCQAGVLEVILLYIKQYLPAPGSLMFDNKASNASKTINGGAARTDPDLELAWRSVLPLTSSSSPVVLSWVIRVLMETATENYRHELCDALMLLLEHPHFFQIALDLILLYTSKFPEDLEGSYHAFFLAPNDDDGTERRKLLILARLLNQCNGATIIAEIAHYVYARESILAATILTQLAKHRVWRTHVYPTVLDLLSHPNQAIASEAILAIKYLFLKGKNNTKASDEATTTRVLTDLVRMLPDCSAHAAAKATLIYCYAINMDSETIQLVLVDLLRMLARTFADDPELVRLSTLSFATKARAAAPKHSASDDVVVVADYIISLGLCNPVLEIREKAHFCACLLQAPEFKDLVASSVYAKYEPDTDQKDPSLGLQPTTLENASLLLPDFGPWEPQCIVDPSLRDVPESPLPKPATVPSQREASQVEIPSVGPTLRQPSQPTTGPPNPPIPVQPAAPVSFNVQQTLEDFLGDSSPAPVTHTIADSFDPDAIDLDEEEIRRQLELIEIEEQANLFNGRASPSRSSSPKKPRSPSPAKPSSFTEHNVWNE